MIDLLNRSFFLWLPKTKTFISTSRFSFFGGTSSLRKAIVSFNAMAALGRTLLNDLREKICISRSQDGAVVSLSEIHCKTRLVPNVLRVRFDSIGKFAAPIAN